MTRKKILILAVLVAAGGAAGYGYYVYSKKETPPIPSTAKVTRADIAETVGATGQLQAVTTVQVGTQVSGTVQALNADFNSLVHKGQVIARLDPSLFQTQIEQARANLIRAQADLDRLRVSLNDAQTKLKRAEDLFAQKLISQVDLEAAQVGVQSADAQLKSQQAGVTQAQATLQQNQVNLDHTVITAPIDGLVISRNVDVGQTVAASMQAPTLFVLAADLTKMQVIASLDESDVGRIRPGQLVRFRVDAYPNQEFTGSVTQLRLQPVTVQNVVTYSTVIDVPNPDLKLKPGMTANVNIEIARRSNVLRVPNAALRFRPTAEIFQALGQAPPAGGMGGRGGRDRGIPPPGSTDSMNQGTSSSPTAQESPSQQQQQPQEFAAASAKPTPPSSAPSQQASAPGGSSSSTADGARRRRNRENADTSGTSTADSGRGRGEGPPGSGENSGRGFGGGRGGGRGNFQERLANMTPDERQAFMERMRARGLDPEATMARAGGTPAGDPPSGAAPSSGRGPGSSAATTDRRQTQSDSGKALAKTGPATTIDALFGPLPRTESFGQVWLYQEGKLSRVPLRLGITDGQQTELIQGNLTDGQDVVTNVITAAQRTAAAAGSAPGIFGNQGRGFPGGGGFGGGGNRGGGGGRGGR
jgi:HlyD family secretion protein